MQACRRLLHRQASGVLPALAWLAGTGGAAAQTAPAEDLARRLQTLEAQLAGAALSRGAAWLLVVGVLLAFLAGAWTLLRRLADQARTAAAGGSSPLLDQPLGVPEGSVRALVSLFIVVFGFLLLALQAPLGLTSGEALTGFIGTVITFYFATRGGEQARAMVAAAERATAAAETAGSAADAARDAAARGAAPAPGTAPGTAREARALLGDAQAKLQALRGVVAVAGSLGVGTGAVAGADQALARVDGLLGRIAPVLGGDASAETVGRLAEEAAGALRDLGALGPVGTAVADAMTTIGRVAGESAPLGRALGGLLGGGAMAGPAGLAAAVVLGGLQLVQERERFERWKAAMLDAPLDLGLLPAAVDGGLATAALLRAPLLAARLAPGGTVEPALALAVWEAAGIAPGAAPEPARELAARILAGAAGEGEAALRGAFPGSAEALAEAIEDLRAAMTGLLAVQGLPAVAVGGAEIPAAALADAVRAARQDGRAAAELERMVYLSEALGRADPATRAAVAERLGSTAFLRAAAPAEGG